MDTWAQFARSGTRARLYFEFCRRRPRKFVKEDGEKKLKKLKKKRKTDSQTRSWN